MKILHVTPADDLQHILLNICEPTTIYIAAGVYRGKFVVPCDDVRLVGESREKCIISYDDYAKKPHSDGKEYNTFRTYTLCVTGERVTLENLTVENANTRPEEVGQCVALSVNAKIFRAANVDLKSTQDTLFTAPFPDDLVARYSGLAPEPNTGETYYDGFIPREQLYMEGGSVQLYENCRIYGNVDFIFGGAEAYFYCCELISLHEKRGYGFVAAPSHSLREEYGYSFINCNFTSGGAEDGSVFLARPWRDFGKCSFIGCTLGRHIAPALFDKWNQTYRDRTARFGFYNLSGEISPVGWAENMTKARANEIINRFNKIKKSYFE